MKLVLMQRLAGHSMSIRQGTICSHIYCSMINGYWVGSIMRDNTCITIATLGHGNRAPNGHCASSFKRNIYNVAQGSRVHVVKLRARTSA